MKAFHLATNTIHLLIIKHCSYFLLFINTTASFSLPRQTIEFTQTIIDLRLHLILAVNKFCLFFPGPQSHMHAFHLAAFQLHTNFSTASRASTQLKPIAAQTFYSQLLYSLLSILFSPPSLFLSPTPFFFLTN